MGIFAAILLAATIDRIAALVDRQVLTVSEIGQMAEIRFFPRTSSWSDDDYRKNILDALIAQVPRVAGTLFRPIQNGLVQFYALAMIAGLTVFLIALVRSLSG